jgi:DNA-binding IclR family transcriptional regulator
LTETIVKSAGRVFEVLEYFDDVRQAATVMEIARALDYPQSSTSVLLHSMVVLGYLHHDPKARTYIPTARIKLFGSWIDAPFFREGSVMELMHEVGAATGELVLLAVQDRQLVRYIHVVPATNPVRLHMRAGTVRSLIRSGVGKLFLSLQPDEQVRKLVHRLNAEEANPAFRVRLCTLFDDLAQIRACGYSVATHEVTPGASGVSVLLPGVSVTQPMAVAIAGVSDQVVGRSAQFVEAIRTAIRTHLGVEPNGTGPVPSAVRAA